MRERWKRKINNRRMEIGEGGKWERYVYGRRRFMGEVCIWEREFMGEGGICKREIQRRRYIGYRRGR